MKNRLFFFLLLLAAFTITRYAQAQEEPLKAMDTPQKVQKMQDRMSIDIGKDEAFQGVPWIVYSDRANNQTYDGPGSNTEMRKAQFLQKFIITETRSRYAHIYQDGNFDYQTWNLSETAIDFGWIDMYKLILSTNCLVTKKSEISLKCMVMNTIASVQNTKEVASMDHEVVHYHSDPGLTQKTGDYSQLFQILYVYKIHYVGGKPFSILVGTSNKYIKAGDENEVREVIKGWVDYNRLTLWDTRIALEPNAEDNAGRERKTKNVKATVLTSVDKANEFSQGIAVNNKFILWNMDSFTVRRVGDWRRFPVLDTIPGIYKVGCMGDIKDSTGMNQILSLDEDAQAKRAHGFSQLSRRNINMVFVVDGTSSMGPYYQGSIVPAISEIINRINKFPTQNNVRFGGVVYRDVLEGPRLVQTKSLTDKTKVNEVINFFKNIEAKDYNDLSKPEAMYYGLKTALRTIIQDPSETNVVILIGDAGNHAESEKTYVDENSLITLMADRRIFCIVFQVHNGVELTYDDFQTQTKNLVLQTGKIIYRQGEDVRKSAEGYNQGNVYWDESPKGSNNWKLMNYGYYATAMYANKGEKKGTDKLKEEIVSVFKAADEYTNTLIKAANQIVEEGKSFKQVVQETEEKEIVVKESEASSVYADVYGPGLIEYFRNLGLPNETIEKLFQERWQFYSEGWIPKEVNKLSYPPFTKSLLYSSDEFSRLIEILNKLDDASNSVERRERLEATWREVLSDYIGIDRKTIGELTIGEATNMLFGLPSPTSFINEIKIDEIHDRTMLNDKSLALYCLNIERKASNLRELNNMIKPREVFITNNIKYYWILEHYIP